MLRKRDFFPSTNKMVGGTYSVRLIRQSYFKSEWQRERVDSGTMSKQMMTDLYGPEFVVCRCLHLQRRYCKAR